MFTYYVNEYIWQQGGCSQRKAVLSLQHDIEGDVPCLASDPLQRLNSAPEDESEDVWPAQVF